jgi:phosphoglycolate phosphatase-like HAD superfamily hydrolase
VLRTIECEAAVFGCDTVDAHPTEKGGAPDPSCLLAVPGADHLLDRIPAERWGALTAHDVDVAIEQFRAADLPLPGILVPRTSSRVEDYVAATTGLGADPQFCLAIEDSPRGVDAARQLGMKVIGVATALAAGDLAAADMVIPSLLSLHVVGLHPVLVLEVDALPGFGTFVPGSNNRF